MSGICDREAGEWGEEEVRVRVLGEIKCSFPMTNPVEVRIMCGTWVDNTYRT